MAEAAVQFQKAMNQLTHRPTPPNVSEELEPHSAVGAGEMFGGVGNRPCPRQAQELWEPPGSPSGAPSGPLGKLVLLQFGELDQEAQRGSTRFAVSK
jgi:hypothetical protein